MTDRSSKRGRRRGKSSPTPQSKRKHSASASRRSPQPSQRVVVSCILERSDGYVLIVTAHRTGDVNRRWEFPCGILTPRDKSAEAAARRVARETVGLSFDIHTGQPPFAAEHQGQPAFFRYFIGSVPSVSNIRSEIYNDLRWVHEKQLCEYDFLSPHDSVMEWYADSSA